MVPALLIYGAQDKFVTLEEEQWMQEVSDRNNKGLHLCSIFTDLLCCFQCSRFSAVKLFSSPLPC